MILLVPVLSLISNTTLIDSSFFEITLPTTIIYIRGPLIKNFGNIAYLTNLLSIDFKSVLWGDWCFIKHLECHWCENLIFALLLLLTALISTAKVIIIVGISSSEIIVRGGEESWIVISELYLY